LNRCSFMAFSIFWDMTIRKKVIEWRWNNWNDSCSIRFKIQDSRFMNDEKIREFTDLKVWKEAHELVLMIYKVTGNFPKEEMFGLISQMRRSSISITANIAEGFGRQGYKEKVQFYYLAQGSITELKDQIIIARDIDYLESEEYAKLNQQIVLTHRLLQGLITKSKEFLNLKS